MIGDKDNGASSPNSSLSQSGSAADVIEQLDKNSVLDQTPIEQQANENFAKNTGPLHFSRFRIIGLTMLCIGLLGGGILVYRSSAITAQQSALNSSAPVKPQAFGLQELSKSLSSQTPESVDKLNVNGQLNANDSLVLAATSKPSNAVAGQIYYDQTRHQLGYYDGTDFVYLRGGNAVISNKSSITNNYSTSTVNNYSTTTNNPVTNITNVTNVTNVSGGSTDSTAGTVGAIAMFTAANTLGDSVITQAGTNLNVGSATGASSTLLQGGTGGVDINTANAAGASGDITIQSGDSSTTGSGNVNIDTGSGVVNGTVIYSGTFETGVDSFTGTPYGSIVTQSNVMARTGTHSLQVPLTLASWASASVGNIPVTPGHTYHWSGWIRAATASSTVVYSEYFNNDPSPAQIITSDSTGSWTQVADTFTVPINTTRVNLNFVYQKNANNEMHYIDDVVLTDLAGYSGLAVNVGTTNAAGVNIGNTNQVGATTITGHGVALAGGNGNVTVNGNYISGTATNQILLQSGTDTSLTTAAANGVSGTITLQSGASSTTAAGNINIDTGSSIVTGTLVATKTFESGLDNMSNNFGYNATLASSIAEAHSGTRSLSITVGTNGEFHIGDQAPYTFFSATAGHTYRFSAWVKAATVGRSMQFYSDFSSTGFSGGGSTGFTQWGTVTDSNSGWTQVTGILVAPASTVSLGIEIYSGAAPQNEVHYLDDLSLTDLSSAAQVAELNLGTINAQSVTLGNSNELGPTSVYGTGLTLDGGLGNTSLTGGAVTINGVGNSSINSNAVLTVTSSGSASWGINPSGFTGGSLTLHAGAAGGVNNGGNLLLQSGSAGLGGVNGNITADAPGQDTVSGTIVDQKGFETGTQNMLAASNTVVAQSNTAVHSGGFSLSTTSSAAGPWEVSQDTGVAGVPVTVGDEYYFSGYVRAAGLTTESIQTIITWAGSSATNTMNTVTESGGTWMHISGVATAPAGATSAYWNFFGSDAGGKVNLFDDLWVTDISSGTSMSSLNLGNNFIQSVNIGNQNQVGATNIKGGAGITIDSSASNLSLSGGSASIVSADGIGATGNIDIQSGTSQSAAPGDINIDTGTGVVSGTQAANLDFETGVDTMVPYTGGSSLACTQAAAQAHGGSFSLSLTGTSSPSCRMDVTGSGIAVIPGHRYFVDGWVRAATTPVTESANLYWDTNAFSTAASVSDTTTGWTELSLTVTAPLGATKAFLTVGNDEGGSSVHYYDDFIVTDVSSLTGYTANLGSTNAKAVKIGNANEVGLTDIQGGGGINLNSGISATTITAGDDSYFTTGGNLLLQGGTSGGFGGGVSINTANNTGSSGNIDIHSGDSSTTASGNVSIDAGAGIVSGTIIDTRDFESGTQAIDPWFGSTVAQSNAQAHGGAESLAVTATGSFVGIIQNGNVSTIPIIAGHHYFFSAWVRAATSPRLWSASISFGCGGGGLLVLGTGTDTTTGWTQITGSGTAPAGSTCATWRITTSGQAVGEVHYFDDFVTTDLSSSSAISDLELGATNAQVVTLGNMNEIGLTTINGGSGITMNSGQATYTVNGGAINVTGSGASMYQTTAGALNITAADASTWQVGTATTGDGGDLTIHAGEGSFGTSNGGNLILQAGSAGQTGTGIAGSVELGTGAGSTLGYTGIGAHQWGGSGLDRISAAKFTTTGGGDVTSMSAYGTGSAAAPNNNFQFAIYTDNSGAPGTYIASSAIGTLPALGGWFSAPLIATLAPTTTYWLVYWQNDSVNDSNNGIAYDTAIPTAINYDNTFTWQSGTNNGMPTNFPVAGAAVNATLRASIYATFATSGPATVLNASGLMTHNGAAIFADPSDSPTAFEIQNSTGTALLTADTNAMDLAIDGSISVSGANGAINLYNQSGTATNGFQLASDTNNLYIVNLTDAQTAMEFDRANSGPSEARLLNDWGLNVKGDNANALLIQDSSTNPVLSVDTTSKIVTVASLVVTADLTLEGHVISSGTAPTHASGAASDCSSTGTVSVSGNDTSGTVTITTGAGPCSSSGVMATITFATAFGGTPRVMLSPSGVNASTLQYYNGAASVNNFTIDTNTNPAATTTYKYNYWVVQ
ncbi:MAG TPA: carbohydrate binding domain-containing protein [Candidatus Saccharimonadales bacterium]|nr:carbohydrate binding domain-containing protein [Candidatus Saccharimonadales bacterium]